MPDATLAGIAALVGGAWVLGLWYLGLYTHPAVRSWQRLARLRGLADRRPWGDRLGERLPLLRRAQEETDIGRLLTIAGRGENATAWLLRIAFQAGLALSAVLLMDELAILSGRSPALPPAVGLVAASCLALLAYVRLRRQASDRQQALSSAIADTLPNLSVMTFHHRVPAAEALLIFARCQRDQVLHDLLTSEAGRHGERTTNRPGVGQPAPARSTALMYEQIGQDYGVPMFTALGSAVRRVTERGLTSQDVYTGLSRTTYAERLAEAKVAAAQTKTLIVIPMGLMIVPVLVLIGAPLIVSLTGIFAH